MDHLRLDHPSKIELDLAIVTGWTFAYRLQSTGHSSQRYGACEVCKEHATEVFTLEESRGFPNPRTGLMSYTYHGVRPTIFGHRDCVISKQKEVVVPKPQSLPPNSIKLNRTYRRDAQGIAHTVVELDLKLRNVKYRFGTGDGPLYTVEDLDVFAALMTVEDAA